MTFKRMSRANNITKVFSLFQNPSNFSQWLTKFYLANIFFNFSFGNEWNLEREKYIALLGQKSRIYIWYKTTRDYKNISLPPLKKVHIPVSVNRWSQKAPGIPLRQHFQEVIQDQKSIQVLTFVYDEKKKISEIMH